MVRATGWQCDISIFLRISGIRACILFISILHRWERGGGGAPPGSGGGGGPPPGAGGGGGAPPPQPRGGLPPSPCIGGLGVVCCHQGAANCPPGPPCDVLPWGYLMVDIGATGSYVYLSGHPHVSWMGRANKYRIPIIFTYCCFVTCTMYARSNAQHSAGRSLKCNLCIYECIFNGTHIYIIWILYILCIYIYILSL